ncbi:hypothetical protein SAMN02745244_03603, partial [Tessaracoccus bendigoensis DSM 12906]
MTKPPGTRDPPSTPAFWRRHQRKGASPAVYGWCPAILLVSATNRWCPRRPTALAGRLDTSNPPSSPGICRRHQTSDADTCGKARHQRSTVVTSLLTSSPAIRRRYLRKGSSPAVYGWCPAILLVSATNRWCPRPSPPPGCSTDERGGPHRSHPARRRYLRKGSSPAIHRRYQPSDVATSDPASIPAIRLVTSDPAPLPAEGLVT